MQYERDHFEIFDVDHVGQPFFLLIWLAFGETYPYLGKVHHGRTLFSRTLESWLVRGIIPKLPYFSLVNYYNSRSLRDENRLHQV